MQDIINNIGESNLYIIIGIIIAIIIALVIIIIIENRSKKEYDDIKIYKKEVKETPTISDFELTNIEPPVIQPNFKEEYHEEPIVQEVNQTFEPKTKEEAKKAIEDAAKKIVYEENNLVGPTFFEKVQEENSIISYEELVSSDVDIDKENELLIADEGNEPITLDELYNRKEEVQKEIKTDIKIPTIDEKQLIEKADIIIESEELDNAYKEPKKFKSSEVISPVYGVKRDVIYKKEYNELGETINIEELEVEIKRTEEFLKELKKLKNKLD